MFLTVSFFFLADDGEVFQVKKSTQSKKIMKLLDRERKKKKEVKKEGDKIEAVECEDKMEDALDLVVMHTSVVFVWYTNSLLELGQVENALCGGGGLKSTTCPSAL
jgi:hypothetical protein